MSGANWIELVVFIGLLCISTPILGSYMAKVYGGGKAPGDRVFLPIERGIYRLCGIDPESEQRWSSYVIAMLVFTFVGMLLTYVTFRLQGHLPLNPDGMKSVTQALSFNTAISFSTNTNWQNYVGEATLSHLSQMFGLVWHQFISAAVGMALAVAFIRALVRRRQTTIGNFWVDTVRGTLRILLPIAFVFALVFMSQGVIQNFNKSKTVNTVAATATHSKDTTLQQKVPGGPVASMVPIEALGDNGGGFFNANGSHPFEGPNAITSILIVWLTVMIPFAFPWTFGKMAGDVKQGIAVLSAMLVLWLAVSLVAMVFEAKGNANLSPRSVDQRVTATQGGALRVVDDRYVYRRHRRDARQLHADRRRGAPRQHDVR
jgi:potassium-transporting ATPase potassium-binding subunit